MLGTRRFFIACSVIAVLIVVVLAGSVMQQRDLPAEVAAGYDVWRAHSCEECHTLYGQGGAYAPDLTHIYSQRGEGYLHEFLINPNAYHPDQRVMPRFNLTRTDTDNLMAFLNWTGQQNTNFPPRVIQVSGGGNVDNLSVPKSASSQTSDIPTDPVERGHYWFSRPPAICATCHSVQPNIVIVGPSLSGIATRAATRVPGQDAETYIRNSILHPSAYVVDGFPDAMQKNFADVLSSDQINDIIAFLMTLK